MTSENSIPEDVFDDEGNLLDDNDEVLFCDSCEATAHHRVAVSINEPHDDDRVYCESCYEVYMVGVQHGRYHEARRHGAKPGRDSSQEIPEEGP